MSDIDQTTEDEKDYIDLEYEKAMADIAAKYGLSETAPETASESVAADESAPPQEAPLDTAVAESSETVETSQESAHDDIAEKRVKDAQARMTRATQEAADLRRENGDLRSAMAQLQQQFQQLQEQYRQAYAALQVIETAPKDEELPDFDKAAEDFEDLNPLVVKAVKNLDGQLKRIKETESRRLAEIEREIEMQRRRNAENAHLAAIKAEHKDYDAIVSSQDFPEWIDRQPRAIQNIAREGSADDVIWLLSQYKTATGKNRPVAHAPKPVDKSVAVPTLRTAPNSRDNGKAGKVPFSSIKHLSASEMLQKYPDESVIDYAA